MFLKKEGNLHKSLNILKREKNQDSLWIHLQKLTHIYINISPESAL